jgi:hypothetical protein
MTSWSTLLLFRSLHIFAALCLFFSLFSTAAVTQPDNPLPSWNGGENKTAITDFVDRATDENGPDFVVPSRRIAVFNNDDSLWTEKPLINES